MVCWWRLGWVIKIRAANSILVRLNQIGTLTEALDAVRIAHRAGWTVVISQLHWQSCMDSARDVDATGSGLYDSACQEASVSRRGIQEQARRPVRSLTRSKRKLMTTRSIAKVYTKVGLHQRNNDFAFWQTQPYLARLTALEEIRREYHRWRYGAEPGFERVFQWLNDNQVRYLVVGGYAVALHGHPHYTKDIDVWIELGPDNAERMIRALQQFGFGSLGLDETDFVVPGSNHSVGYRPAASTC